MSEGDPSGRWQADGRGRFGRYGGRFVPEVLVAAVAELCEAYPRITATAEFREELDGLLASYAGRPTPLYLAKHMSDDLGGARVYLKREDLAHTGEIVAHVLRQVERRSRRCGPGPRA